jgi:hypothetical protein
VRSQDVPAYPRKRESHTEDWSSQVWVSTVKMLIIIQIAAVDCITLHLLLAFSLDIEFFGEILPIGFAELAKQVILLLLQHIVAIIIAIIVVDCC